MALIVGTVGAALAGTELLPQPWRAVDHALFQHALWPALAVVIALLAARTAGLIWRARTTTALPIVRAEEPRLAPVSLGAGRTETRVVTLAGLERGSGVSTLTFNLAVSLAVHSAAAGEDGSPRPVRPACVLAEGPLSAALGLSPGPLEDRLEERGWDVRPEVINLGVRHPSGCVLFCLKACDYARGEVRLLLTLLRRHYDAVLVDGGIAHGEMTGCPIDVSDFVLLVGQPTESSIEPAGRWIERVFKLRWESRTGMVVNRVRIAPPPDELLLAFYYLALLPEEATVPALDGRGIPWSLDERLTASRQLVSIVRQLFPTLVAGGGQRAA